MEVTQAPMAPIISECLMEAIRTHEVDTANECPTVATLTQTAPTTNVCRTAAILTQMEVTTRGCQTVATPVRLASIFNGCRMAVIRDECLIIVSRNTYQQSLGQTCRQLNPPLQYFHYRYVHSEVSIQNNKK